MNAYRQSKIKNIFLATANGTMNTKQHKSMLKYSNNTILNNRKHIGTIGYQTVSCAGFGQALKQISSGVAIVLLEGS